MTELGPLVARGRTSDVFAFGSHAVVKVPRAGVPEGWAMLEAEFSVAVHQAGLPSQTVLDVVEVDGRQAVMFARVNGPSMWELMVAAPDRVIQLAQQLADIQLEIHHTPAPRTLPRLVDRLRQKIARADSLSESDRHEAALLMDSLPSGDALCHGDLHPGNVLMSPTGPVIIDWFDCAVGPSVADLVRTSLLIRPGVNEPAPCHLPGAHPALLASVHATYVNRVCRSQVFPPELLLDWESVLAVSRIVEGAQASDADLLDLWNARRSNKPSLDTTPLASTLCDLGLVRQETA